MELSEKNKDCYLIYNRKSTDDAESQKNSLGYQRMRNLEFAKREELMIAPLTVQGFCEQGIIDERHSAYKEEAGFELNAEGYVQYRVMRPKFLKLVELLSQQKIKGVIFLCWDRASRNPQDDAIIQKLGKLGCDIRFCEVTYDKTSSGYLHMGVDGMFASHYSRVIGEKVRNAYAKLRAEGKCLYFVPIGYLDRGSSNKPFDPERAPVVKRVFELYATGEWSFVQLAKWAREQGLTNRPVRHKRTQEEMLNNVDPSTFPKIAHPVTHKTIESMLRNPFYIGLIRAGKEFRKSTAHQPLIDTALFNKVQQMLKKRTQSVHYIDKPFFTYRKLVRCGCTRTYTPYEQKGLMYYRSNCKDGCTNSIANLSEAEITGFIQDALDKIYFTEDELAEIERRAAVELAAVADQRDKKLQDLHARQRNLLADIEYITQNRISLIRTGGMTPDAVVAEETRLNGALNVVHEEIRAYGESAQEMLRYVISFSELVRNASTYFKYALDSEKREIATQVFYEIVVTDKKVENYVAKDGFDALLRRVGVTGGR
ncbi:MAG TPA: recombinase family protein [Candidatus Paceibacterota bacterium]|jgi:DNA invertase Pin-like site-specific DNA recombinase|nr:recombinase family protein [Candidatus Paceibacterota bacterium]